MRSSVLLLVLVVFASAVHAEIYRYTDENGNVVYSDEKREGAEKIEVKPLPTVDLPDGPITPEALDGSLNDNLRNDNLQIAPPNPYRSVTFTAPEDNTAFWSGSGNIVLAVEAEPALRENHRYEVLLDGQLVGRNSDGTFTVQHVDRGTHTATVQIVSESDALITTGQSITFTVHRPSVNSPAR